MSPRLTIGEVARQAGVAATTLRYYEQIGLVPPPGRLGGQRRYDDSVLARLEVIRLCKSAGFALEEIQLLFADDAPGRPASRALAEAKLAEIDAQMESLAQARAVIEWGMRCTCPSIDACTCGIHTALPA
ncbi:MerR family transcriptional regulator [Mycobacterium sp. E3251]|uniref:helix-turn-helix domain-containing protein n=1 Tax=unclassified Mycobacterium TaxID=2642494 RepID=UPI0008011F9A|nr:MULTISPECIES: helix-turn-helix domain-containing protein [unclassified Mycobacterium]OBF54698.1 MerR family transcriptional regulator [Mycobacterium sp. 852002-53434_SCH5985345]OBF74836.1 MerR family transcriptional regulator [Mycobacterium sp. 852002-51613_SCH5001154]OBF98722.1 MerR family transcriptional regulator [Mycobacterium sp. 852014-52450_SCH5900713]OBG94248.1 MerR family transcriptional regulator [Mycobacterium sp. E3251]OBI26073.1 MerR family transcriptional regulator [Mycobacter